jgi:hypothetical protein
MKLFIRHLIDTLVMDIDAIQDAEIERMRVALARMEGKNKRKSVQGSFSVKKKLRVAPITKRMRSTGVTPRTAKKADTRTSRSRQMQARRLTFDSVSRSRSGSRPKSMNIDTPLLKSVQYTQSREVRHKNARKVLNKMPAGGKSYARGRKSMRKPKGAYRGAVMPRWAKGETKHILANDNCDITIAAAATGLGSFTSDDDTGIVSRDATGVGEEAMDIGACHAWCLNPVKQGTGQTDRNGRSVDGTYLRIQGHIRNASTVSKAYVRMVVLAVKGGISSGPTGTRMGAPFVQGQLFKRIDGTVTGFIVPSGTTGQGSALVRTLQLPINKSLYTVLYDQKMQLADNQESFGSADRLFDAKIPLKQRTQFGSAKADSFEKNQLVFAVMTVDPLCRDAAPVASDPVAASDLNDKIFLEFESKYSYKDF